MTRREELAAQFLAGVLGDPAQDKTVPSACVERAFTYADFFLAACEPEQKPEREPDAVWEISDPQHCGYPVLRHHTDINTSLNSLLAGRDRVELEVRVREVKA